MQSAPKLKWNKAKLLIYAGFLYLISLILEDQLFGTRYATWIWGGIYMLWGVTQSLRTKMAFYAILGILGGLGAWHYQIADQGDTFLSMPTFIVHLTVILLFMFMFGEKIFDHQQTLEKNARRLFEHGVHLVTHGRRTFPVFRHDFEIAAYHREWCPQFM